jgi:lipopolysaccharide export system permease protein
MILTYQKNVIFTFLKNILSISIFFFSLILILSILQEIIFFKNLEVDIFIPLYLTFLNTSSIVFELFPFIFLIGAMSFFIEILDKNELIIYKSYGLSNLKIISVIVSTTFVLGILLVLIFYNISSNLKFVYLEIKNKHTNDDKYLAVVTANGLWIKDHMSENINYINAKHINNENLTEVIINQFDIDYNLIRSITAKDINIKSKNWIINNAKITKDNLTLENKEPIIFKTNFNIEIISTLFSNLSALNLIKLNKLKKNYTSLGYSTVKINNHLLSIYTYPIYLSIMVCIASILMLNIGHNKPRVFYLIIGILISVTVYYTNYLFNILVENQKISFQFSIWSIQFLLLLLCSVGLVRINEK